MDDGLNTYQIDALLLDDEVCSKMYAGAFPCDEFVREYDDKTRQLFVVNSHPSNAPGEHWIVVWREGEKVNFFDSYGIPIQMYPSVAKRLRGKNVVETSDRLQGLTPACGHYCASFCLFVSRGWSMQEFVNYWLDRPARDQMVMTNINGRLRELSSRLF